MTGKRGFEREKKYSEKTKTEEKRKGIKTGENRGRLGNKKERKRKKDSVESRWEKQRPERETDEGKEEKARKSKPKQMRGRENTENGVSTP